MKNLKRSSQAEIDLAELGLMIRLVKLEYAFHNNEELARRISEEFGVYCEEKDVDNYERLTLVNDDLELENRKIEHGYQVEY